MKKFIRLFFILLGIVLLLLIPYGLNKFSLLLPEHVRIDKLVVVKSEKKLHMMSGEQSIKSYRVALGKSKGRKTRRDDGKTPEGIYENCTLIEKTRYHKAILITYPNLEERRMNYTGGSVEIHGLSRLPLHIERYFGFWIVLFGRTDGCIMLSNQDMDEMVKFITFPVTVEIKK